MRDGKRVTKRNTHTHIHTERKREREMWNERQRAHKKALQICILFTLLIENNGLHTYKLD